MRNSALIRPAWTPATIALMVLGFIFFWPLGLAMLAYIIWGDRLDGFKRNVNEKTDSVFSTFSNCCKKDRSPFSSSFGGTGNAAFDEWRKQELDRLDEERRKLDEARAEFETYAEELRRARDKQEFDRFMSQRRAGASADNAPAPRKDNDGDGVTGA
ncbi:DUF2852 domain-containing protein [Falsochrobactrum ovis]|uniref:Uncharacterized protein DUF2852 n=1 Tax=Falsochrobactrum ovis TaxID=1293442 RepID=A0A364JZ89_9HYPH|nr:DUF2852 domain-containing protein [Falsochrobactrum ovis]RAK33869.1 uncharacterized protein DUF2852 [Falsochrobactrum ovis]